MPVLDITKPDVIRFLNECYERTTKARLQWIHKHPETLKAAATLNREEKGYHEEDVFRANIDLVMPTVVRDYISAGANRRRKPAKTYINTTKDLKKEHSIVAMGLGDPKEDPRLDRSDECLEYDPIMRPVDEKQKEILYKNQPTHGRKAYLRNRCKLKPEDRFYFQECTSWGHGWRYKDSAFGRNNPTRPRVMSLTKGIQTRAGPQPDPIHYKSAEERAKKCF